MRSSMAAEAVFTSPGMVFRIARTRFPPSSRLPTLFLPHSTPLIPFLPLTPRTPVPPSVSPHGRHPPIYRTNLRSPFLPTKSFEKSRETNQRPPPPVHPSAHPAPQIAAPPQRSPYPHYPKL